MVRFRLGHFDPPDMVPFTKLSSDRLCSPEHRALARRAARESMVLLKNEGRVLPLSKSLKRVALIGPHSDQTYGGGYSGRELARVTPVDGIREKLGPDAVVEFCEGGAMTGDLSVFSPLSAAFLSPPGARFGEQGLLAEYFAGASFDGAPAMTQVERGINGEMSSDWLPPALRRAPRVSIRWSGELHIERGGNYALATVANGAIRITIDGKVVVDQSEEQEVVTQAFALRVESGRRHRIVVEYQGKGPNAVARLGAWGQALIDAAPAQALAIASRADFVVVMAGLSKGRETEGLDRTNLRLPDDQLRLIRELAALKKPVVLVLVTGGAIALGEVKDLVSAVVVAWYPGQESGGALADVLFGDHNPTGRLPITFYASESDLPPFKDYSMAGRTYRYFKGEPEFPFGFGLSYTRFAYSDLRMQHSGETVRASVVVENAGEIAGEEVVQLYISRDEAGAPLRELRDFTKVNLAPGEKRRVAFTLTREQMAALDAEGNAISFPSSVRILIGPNYRDGLSASLPPSGADSR